MAQNLRSIINRYLQGSPMAGQADALIRAGQTTGVDPRVFAAIATKESSLGRAMFASHNPFGFNVHHAAGAAGPAFPNFEAAAEAVGRTLSGSLYKGRGAKTLSQIIPIYAPPSENDTSLYVQQVNQLARKLGMDPSQSVFGPVQSAQNVGGSAAVTANRGAQGSQAQSEMRTPQQPDPAHLVALLQRAQGSSNPLSSLLFRGTQPGMMQLPFVQGQSTGISNLPYQGGRPNFTNMLLQSMQGGSANTADLLALQDALHPSAQATNAAAPGTTPAPNTNVRGPISQGFHKYVNPVSGPGFTPERIDMGVDYNATGGKFRALGDAVVTQVDPHANWGGPGNGWVSYKLLSGPMAGRHVYVAEHITPQVRVGQRLNAGDVVATGSGQTETGWAAGPDHHYSTYASVYGGGYSEGQGTKAGLNFSNLIASLGGPRGTAPTIGYRSGSTFK